MSIEHSVGSDLPAPSEFEARVARWQRRRRDDFLIARLHARRTGCRPCGPTSPPSRKEAGGESR
jgi:hypothetical protein